MKVMVDGGGVMVGMIVGRCRMRGLRMVRVSNFELAESSDLSNFTLMAVA